MQDCSLAFSVRKTKFSWDIELLLVTDCMLHQFLSVADAGVFQRAPTVSPRKTNGDSLVCYITREAPARER